MEQNINYKKCFPPASVTNIWHGGRQGCGGRNTGTKYTEIIFFSFVPLKVSQDHSLSQ